MQREENMKKVGIISAACLAVLCAGSSPAAFAAGQNGTTLAASKTIDICTLPSGQWRYSGEVSVWNSGAVDTVGFKLIDYLQNKISGPVWTDSPPITLSNPGDVIPAGTTDANPVVYPYAFEGAPLAGDIRNVAELTITNHSGHLNTPFGPSPKATYIGTQPPPACEIPPGGCVRTQGYWGSKPGVVWPAPPARTDTFYYSGMTYQQVMDSPSNPANGGNYIKLGHQFIAATLNANSGAPVPAGVQSILNLAAAWFNTPANTPASCSTGGSCALQNTWQGILDSYNKGTYPGGPAHCVDDYLDR
jgi:hypothetical protein